MTEKQGFYNAIKDKKTDFSYKNILYCAKTGIKTTKKEQDFRLTLSINYIVKF